MSSHRVSVSVSPEVSAKGRELVQSVIDPEIAKFSAWLREKENGNSSITPMEKELLRAYLYQKLIGTI